MSPITPTPTTASPSSPKFNPKHPYAPQPEIYFNDGRELTLLTHLHSLAHLRNNPPAILSAIDAFASEHYLMNIGELKGRHITSLLSAHAPLISLELGGYIGYSAVLFGSAVRAANPAAVYYVLEADAVFAAIIMSVVELAGLGGTVRVVTGAAGEGVARLAGEGLLAGGVDFLFLDHLKSLYTADLQGCERLGLVRKGTVVVADNMIKPGNPVYHRWVNLSCEEKMKEGGGDGRLVYESEWVESWEPQGVPDAIEVTRCVERLEE